MLDSFQKELDEGLRVRFLMSVTIFCGFLGFTQAQARPITYRSLQFFVSIAGRQNSLAAKLDAALSASIHDMAGNMHTPSNVEFFQILMDDKEMQEAIRKLTVVDSQFKTIQILQAMYAEGRARELRDRRKLTQEEQFEIVEDNLANKEQKVSKKQVMEYVSHKMRQLSLTQDLGLVSEIFAALPTQESMLQKISATNQGTSEVKFWRRIFKDLISYTHSENTPLRRAITQSLTALSAKGNFKSEKIRSQWKEYFNDVWADMHPSNTMRVRACLRVLAGQ